MDKIIKLDIPQGYEYIGIDLADGKLLLKKKPIEYPKTYEKSCEVFGIEADLWFVYEDIDGNHINPACISNYRMRRLDLYHNLEKLIICRDAYWKIAGEEMDLCKSWKPEYEALVDNMFFTIQTFNGEIDKSATSHRNSILAFPTKEMRDAFYENFKDLIEQCKELL
jgi:hypothetical protein